MPSPISLETAVAAIDENVDMQLASMAVNFYVEDVGSRAASDDEAFDERRLRGHLKSRGAESD